jgi:hypothetical protein
VPSISTNRSIVRRSMDLNFIATTSRGNIQVRTE